MTEIIFYPPKVSDKTWVTNIIEPTGNMSMDYSFGILYLWQDIYGNEIAQKDGYFLGRSAYAGRLGNCSSYLFPVGPTREGEYALMEKIIVNIKETGRIPLFYGMTKKKCDALEAAYPGRFHFEENRTTFEYIYETEKMISLSGKKLRNKRHEINKFIMDNPNWEFELITKENLPECIGMYREWYEKEGGAENPGLVEEHRVMERAMIDFFALDYVGGLLRVNGRLIAFTFGERLSDTTFISHVEKADTDYPGSYQMINREFSEHCLADYVYVNREDDVNDENLRQAKLSYRPAILLEKYHVFLKEDYAKVIDGTVEIHSEIEFL